MSRTTWLSFCLVAMAMASVPAWAQDAPPAAAPAAPPAAEPAAPTAGYELQLQELEDRINELKEDVFSSKARLALLREQVLNNNIGGARAIITHVNDLGSHLRLVEATYVLDGNQLWAATRDTNDQLPRMNEREVYNASILPGPHNLAVRFMLEGNGFGLFAYMNGYQFEITQANAFTVDEGRTIQLDVVVTEAGGANVPLEERPSIEFLARFSETTETSVADESANQGEAGE